MIQAEKHESGNAMKTLLVVTAAFGGSFVEILATHSLAPALLESVTGDPPNEKEASHFEDLCKEAISNNNKASSSLQEIQAYITTKSQEDGKKVKAIENALKSGVKKGMFIQLKGASYKVVPPRKEKAKPK